VAEDVYLKLQSNCKQVYRAIIVELMGSNRT